MGEKKLGVMGGGGQPPLKNEYFLLYIQVGIVNIPMVSDILELKNEYFLLYIQVGIMKMFMVSDIFEFKK